MELNTMLKKLEMPIQNLGIEMVNEIISVLQQNNKIATGNLINSVKYEYQVDIDTIKLLIQSEDYLEYVDKGRDPGKFVPVDKLREWIRIKGIPEKALYPINYKIFKFGIKPLNFLESIRATYSSKGKFGIIVKEYNKIISDYMKWEFKQIQKNIK